MSAAPSSKHEYSIACMGADGIGPEVIGAGVEVLKAMSEASGGAFKFHFEDYDWSSETYKKLGKYIPDGGLERLKKHDAIFFGAVGAPGRYVWNLTQWRLIDVSSRCTGPYLALGTPTRNLSATAAIRQCTANENPSRDRVASAKREDWRPRLGHCPREQ